MKKAYRTSLDTYDKTAGSLSAVYNGLSTTDVLPGFEERLPDASGGGLNALDLGCGSGRDARWLGEKGFKVLAIDGAAGMIAAAQRDKTHPNVSYMQDFLPGLDAVKTSGRRFDVVLMSAVWMHLDSPDRRKLIKTLQPMLNPEALVFISLRNGPAPRDRPMFALSLDELRNVAADAGLDCETLEGRADEQGRGNVTWDYASLKKPGPAL